MEALNAMFGSDERAIQSNISNESNRIHKLFKMSLSRHLVEELYYIKRVVQGVQTQREDLFTKTVGGIKTLTGILTIAPCGSYVQAVIAFGADIADSHYRNKKKESYQDFIRKAVFDKQPEHLDLYFDAVALECAIRYCGSLYVIYQKCKNEYVIDSLAQLGALRIIHYAVKNKIPSENISELADGLAGGNRSWQHEKFWNYVSGTMFTIESSESKSKFSFSADDFFGRTAKVYAVERAFSFFIDTNPRKGKLVVYEENKASVRELAKYIRNDSIPAFGYVQLPNHIPMEGMSAHNPSGAVLNSLSYISFTGSPVRYVTLPMIEDYLLFCQSYHGQRLGVWKTFSQWLFENHDYRGIFPENIIPCFRGTIDGAHLRRKNLFFEHGKFPLCDFSLSQFENVVFTDFSGSNLFKCNITKCKTGSEGCFNGAVLTMSTIVKSVFENLTGTITIEGVVVLESKFTNCNFTFANFRGANLDKQSLDSMSNCRRGAADMAAVFSEEIVRMQKEIEAFKSSHIKSAADKKLEDEISEKKYQQLLARMESKNQTEPKNLQTQSPYDYKDGTLGAINVNTLEKSIQDITSSVELQILGEVFNAMFFAKPVQKLKSLFNQEVPWTKLPRKCVISTDGDNGRDGENGMDGAGALIAGSGNSGNPGMSGTSGTHAIPNTVSILSIPGQLIFVVTQEYREPEVLPLYDGNVSIELTALGGRGGRGGNGGRGGDGGRGRDGRDATAGSAGGDGENGGNGGPGGSGGSGGNSGNSSNIRINIKDYDTDLLLLVDKTDAQAVKGGVAGDGGPGGRGGSGGSGGASYTYTRSYRDGETTRYETIHNPGGRDGLPGQKGNPGQPGQKGGDGIAGKVVYIVVPTEKGKSVTEYSSIYNLQLTKYHEFTSETGIIEPGQIVELWDFKLVNNGGMPTPRAKFELFVQGNQVIKSDPNKNLLLEQSLQPTEVSVLSSDIRLSFTTHRFTTPLPNDVQRKLTPVKIVAFLPRPNRSLPNFSLDNRDIQISYPVEFSEMRAGSVWTPGTHIPFGIKIKNFSTVALGINASNPRILRLSVTINSDAYDDNDIYITIYDKPKHKQNLFLLNKIAVGDIKYLASDQSIVVSGTVSVQKSFQANQFFQFVPLSFTLHLGDRENPLDAKSTIPVHHEVHDLQISSEFVAINKDDLLLVVNSSTTRKEIEHWEVIAKLLNMHLNVWNASLYYGFQYNHPKLKLFENFADGIVVILNNPFKVVGQSRDLKVSNFIPTGEIFEAARRSGIRTFIVNQPLDNVSEPDFPSGILKPVLQFERSQEVPQPREPQPSSPPISPRKVTRPEDSAIFSDVDDAAEISALSMPIGIDGTNESDAVRNVGTDVVLNADDEGPVDLPQTPGKIYQGPLIEFDRRAIFYTYLKESFTPTKPEKLGEHLPASYQYVAKNKTSLFSIPAEGKMLSGVHTFRDNLQILCPTRQYFLHYRYEPNRILGFLLRRYKVGEIEVRRGLDKNYSMIGFRFVDSPSKISPDNKSPLISQSDLWTVTKLLPLQRKLTLYCSTKPSDEVHAVLAETIVSDIADEYAIFMLYYKKYNKLAPALVNTYLSAFRCFSKFDFFSLLSKYEVEGKKSLYLIFTKLRCLLRLTPKIGMFTGKIAVGQVLRNYLQTAMGLYFPEKKYADLRGNCTDFLNSVRVNEFIQLLTVLRDPRRVALTNATSFNNWLSVDDNDYIVNSRTVNYTPILTEAAARNLTEEGWKYRQDNYYFNSMPKNADDESTFHDLYCMTDLPEAEVKRQEHINAFYGEQTQFRLPQPVIYKNEAGSISREQKTEDNSIHFYDNYLFNKHEDTVSNVAGEQG